MCTIKKICSTWCTYILFLIIILVDIRCVAVLQKEHDFRTCYSCGPSPNNTVSETCKDIHQLMAVKCPRDKSYCITSSSVPFSRYSMSCTDEGDIEAPCSVINTTEELHIKCVCATDLCNTPFTKQFKEIIHKYTIKPKLITKQIDSLNKYIKNNNIITPKDIFEVAKVTNKSRISEEKSLSKDIKAEALKDSRLDDDDDDDVEGSGSFEDQKMKKTIQSPAAPSSYLPSNGNKSGIRFLSITFKLVVLVVVCDLVI